METFVKTLIPWFAGALMMAACGVMAPSHVTEVTLESSPEEDGAPGAERVLVREAGALTLVISEGDDPLRPARWVAARPDGRIAWTRSHDCPHFDAGDRVEPLGGRVVCKTDHAVLGVDPTGGAEAWRWTTDGRLFTIAAAGDRVVVSEDNETLVVLDPASGRVTRRVRLDGAVPEAGAVAGRDPVALLVADATSDPKRLVAQPVGGGPPADGAAEPESSEPLWSAPFEAYSFALHPSGPTVKGVPRKGLEASWALEDGRLQWLDFTDIRPPVSWGSEAGVAAADTAEGRFVVALDPVTRTARWQRGWPYGGGVLRIRHMGGRALVVGDRGWVLYRTGDGVPVAEQPLEAGRELVALGASSRAVTWVERAPDGRREVHHDPLDPAAGASDSPPMPEMPARPDWLRPGARLVYGLIRHEGRDPATGYFRQGQATHFVIDVESVADGLRYAWQSGDGREGRRVLPEEILASSRRHSDLYAAHEGTRTLDLTSIWVSRAVAGELASRGDVTFTDLSAPSVERLERVGAIYHRASFIPADADEGTPRDVQALLARGGDDATYWIAPWADYPLIVRAERPGFVVYLAAVQLPGEVDVEPTDPGSGLSPDPNRMP